MYADTDFFLALLKPNDWLKDKAARRYKKHKPELVSSTVTLVELMYVAREKGIDPERLVVNAANLMAFRELTLEDAIRAAHYASKNPDVGIMDCVHAACAREDVVLSSDKTAFQKLGVKQEKLDE